MLFRFISFLILNLLFINAALGILIECRVLKNKKTGQIIIIYGDMHEQHEVEKEQNGLIINNIENVLEGNIETAILYEGSRLQGIAKEQQQKWHFKNSPLKIVQDYAEELEYDKWNRKVKFVNIDNRYHIYDPTGYFLRMLAWCETYKFYSEEVSEGCNSLLQELKDQPEFSELKYLSKYELDLLFYKNLLKDFDKLKLDINQEIDSSDPVMKDFFYNRMHELEKNIRAHKINSWTTMIAEFFNIEAFTLRNIDMTNEMHNYSVELQDLNTMLYIISRPDVNKFIIFVGSDHAKAISDLLSDADYEKLWHTKLDDFFSNDEPIKMAKELARKKLSAISKDEFDRLNANFDLIAMYNEFCINNSEINFQKEFNKLMVQVGQKIESSNPTLSAWYVYKLEDMIEDMKQEKPENINAEHLKFYKETLEYIEKDFGKKSSGQSSFAVQTSSFSEHDFSNHGICLSTNNYYIGANNNLPQIDQG